MKTTFFIVFYYFLFSVFGAAQEGNTKNYNDKLSILQLSGKVREVRILNSTDNSYTPIVFSLEMDLTNTGSVPLILLREKPVCTNVLIAESLIDLERNHQNISSHNLAVSSNFTNDKAWNKIKKKLNKDTPPSELVMMLAPHTSVKYNYDLRLNLPVKEVQQSSYWKQMSLEQLKGVSSLILKFAGCNFEDYGIVNGRKNNRAAFVNSLQKKWKNHGYLWLESIDSEPIPFDLGSAFLEDDMQ